MIIDTLSYPEISPALLKKLAGPRAYERGVDYYNNGHVEELTIDGDKVWAEVAGTEDYRVDLVYNQRGLTGGCDYPASEGIDFCKHCVAAALALKAELQNQAKQRSTGKPLKKSAKPADIITQQGKRTKPRAITGITRHPLSATRERLSAHPPESGCLMQLSSSSA